MKVFILQHDVAPPDDSEGCGPYPYRNIGVYADIETAKAAIPTYSGWHTDPEGVIWAVEAADSTDGSGELHIQEWRVIGARWRYFFITQCDTCGNKLRTQWAYRTAPKPKAWAERHEISTIICRECYAAK